MVEHNDFAEGGEYAVVYIRVSSANQDTHLSIAAQKEAILKAAEESGYSVVGWYIDGESAEGGDEGGDSEDGFAWGIIYLTSQWAELAQRTVFGLNTPAAIAVKSFD